MTNIDFNAAHPYEDPFKINREEREARRKKQIQKEKREKIKEELIDVGLQISIIAVLITPYILLILGFFG